MADRILDLSSRLGARIPEPEPEVQQPDAAADDVEEIRAEARRYLGLQPDAPLEAIQARFAECYWDHWIFFGAEWRRNKRGVENPNAEFHRTIADRLQALVLRQTEEDQEAFACPREHAKTVIFAMHLMIWAAANQLARFGIYISDTSDQARGVIADIRAELETNERLVAIYPALVEFLEKPRVNYLVLGTECVIAGAGSMKKIRGARWRRFRPDLVVGDDLENDQEVLNPKRRKRKASWWSKVPRKLGRAAVFVVLGTILHADSFLKNQVAGDEDVYRAIVRYPDELEGLWKQWEAVYHDRSLKNRKAAARAFYVANQAAMDRGAEVLWPEMFTLYGLMVERAEDLASFLSERQNDPFDPAGSYFPEIEYLDQRELPADDQVLLTVQFWDPSRGTTKSDTSALPEIDFMKDGRRVVRWAIATQMRPDDVMDASIARHKLRRIHATGVEKVALSSYDEQLEARARAAQVTINLVPVTPKGDKSLRIKSRRGAVVSKQLLFNDALPASAKEQISYYGQHPNDDLWDAIDQALTLGDSMIQDVEPASGTREPEAEDGRLDHEGLFERPGMLSHLAERIGRRLSGGWS
ncbi:hypothetical protein [Longimicrobium sp.]|uniref:hypothetical protein n=1 Tax=Longimicrobium sp. TaxID=2029185 RepID=UPI002EDB8C0D